MDLFLLLDPNSLTGSLDFLLFLEGLAQLKEGFVGEGVEVYYEGWDGGVEFYLGLGLCSLTEEFNPKTEV